MSGFIISRACTPPNNSIPFLGAALFTPNFIALEVYPSYVFSGRVINCTIDGYELAKYCNAECIPFEVKYPLNVGAGDGAAAAAFSAAGAKLPPVLPA